MKIICLTLSFLVFIFTQDCKDDLDLLPMYGGFDKCTLQKKQDSLFVAGAVIEFDTKIYAAHHYKNLGWKSLDINDEKSAIRNFNKSWLLDSESYQCYWGFGNILGRRDQYKEAVKYFEMARKYKPEFAEFYLSSGSAYGKLYETTKNASHLKMAISDFERSASINAKNGEAYAQLTASYYNLGKKDLAVKYLKLSDAINPELVHPELRKQLTGNKAIAMHNFTKHLRNS